MKTIQIQVNNKIYDKLMSILSQFNSKDLKVLNDEVFENDKNYLETQLKSITNGTAEYITIDELDSVLEETIAKYGH